MPAAPKPVNEAERLAALHAYDILDQEADPAYRDIVTIAGQLMHTPIVLISLVDAERQWFLARDGMVVPETPRDMAFCAYTILDGGPLVVRDARHDPRFRDSALVTHDPGIRFYAGAPLETPGGQRIGSLCAMDRVAREATPEQLAAMMALSRQVVRLLEFRLAARQLRDALERSRTLGDLLPVCAGCKRIRNDAQYWQTLERYLETQIGTQVTHSICPECTARLYPE